jgi:hypothetical protein
MILPREHGAWGMVLQPFLGAWLALLEFSWSVIPALACVLLVFLVREPLLVLARQRWIWRERHPETRKAQTTALIELALLALSAGALLWAWPLAWLIALGLAAALLTGLAIYVTIHNRQRAVWFQTLSAAGLSGSCLAACLSITGGIPEWCWWWWALHAAHFLTGILVVHVRLDARIQARRGAPAATGGRREAVVVQGLVALAAAALLLDGRILYGSLLALSAAVHFRGLATAHTPAAIATPMTRVGLRALAVSIVFTLILVSGVWLG